MAKNTFRQYTIRNIPDEVDRILRRRSKLTGKSFNQVAVEALANGSGTSLRRKRDLSFLIGSFGETEAKRIDQEIAAQRKIDRELWK